MSKATKRKHVTKEVLDEFVLPQEKQQIVKVTAGRGNNLHEVETSKQDKFLVSMPTKFRKNVWIKRGDFVLVESISEGDKVRGEIVTILYKDQIKYIKDEGHWPEEFNEEVVTDKNKMIPDDLMPPSDSDSEDDGEFQPLTVVNANRQNVAIYEESSDDSDDDDDDCGEDKT